MKLKPKVPRQTCQLIRFTTIKSLAIITSVVSLSFSSK